MASKEAIASLDAISVYAKNNPLQSLFYRLEYLYFYIS